MRLGPIDEFPFIDAPPKKAVADAYQLLHLLGAVDDERRLTKDGELMARLPVDPRVARLLVVANQNDALREGLVIAAALSVVDPREYGVDPDAARRKHEVFMDARSEFTSYLNLWTAYRRERRGGERALRNWAKEHYLSVARLREWHDVHDQLHELVQGLRWRTRQQAADYRALHQAVLAAFIDFIAEHDDGLVYRGMRESRAQLFAGTPLAKKRPRWLVAAERVATERQYLRTVAQVNPRWALRVAPHLVRFEHDDPQWDPERGQVTAREVVTLFGMRLASERRVDYGRVEPKAARRLFVAEALAADEVGFKTGEPEFLAHNRGVRRAVLDAEARLRKRDLFVGEGGIAAFYDERLPAGVHDRASLAGVVGAGRARELYMTLGDVATRDPGDLAARGYWDELPLAGQRLPLHYAFEPGHDADGITVTVPRPLLGAIRQLELEWIVPAWLPEKVLAYLRALPKEQRRPLVPLPDTARDALQAMASTARRQSLSIALAEALREVRRVQIAPGAFDERALPAHLALRVAVVDTEGRVLGASRDLAALQRELGTPSATAVAAPERWRRSGLTRWDIGDLPPAVTVAQRPQALTLYPALADVEGRVDLKLVPPGPGAVALHRAGVRRLLLKTLPQQAALIREQALADRALVLAYHGVGDTAALVDDLLLASVEHAFELDPPARTEADFTALLQSGRAQLVAESDGLRKLLLEILPLERALRRSLEAAKKDAHTDVRTELTVQLGELVGPRMLTDTPREWRRHLPRYLRAMEQRWEKRGQRNEPELAAEARAAAARLEHWRARQPAGVPWPQAIVEYRWMLEEFRVSLFAQQLGTVRHVSAKRLEQAWRKAVASA